MIDWILSQFDEKRAQAVRAYRRFVSQGQGLDVWDGLRAGSLLGSDVFIERMRPLLLDTPLDPNILRRERDAARPNLKELFADVPDKESRDKRIHEAICCYYYKLQEVGDHLDLHFSTISVIANQIAEVNKIRK